MKWNYEGIPDNNKIVVCICEASTIPFICVYQNGEPTQLVSSFTKKEQNHRFKDVKHKIIAWQYLGIKFRVDSLV